MTHTDVLKLLVDGQGTVLSETDGRRPYEMERKQKEKRRRQRAVTGGLSGRNKDGGRSVT